MSAPARYEKAHAVLGKAIDASFRPVPLEAFTALFPFLTSQEDKNLLYDYYSELVAAMRSNIETEFRTLCDEVGLQDKLRRLEKEVARAQNRSEPLYTELRPLQVVQWIESQLVGTECERLEAEMLRLAKENEALVGHVQDSVQDLVQMRKQMDAKKTAVK